jgi:hypothetical protein
MRKLALIGTLLAALAVGANAETASARGTCTFKHNTLAVGIGISGEDVGAGICATARRILGSAFHSGRATFKHASVACLFQFHSYEIYMGVVGERYGKIAPRFCTRVAPNLRANGWRKLR